jgi:uncharacterized membrane protein YkvA (DUF1232 family)
VRLANLLGRGDEPPRPSDPTLPLRMLIHLPNFVKLYWRLFTDRRVPLFPKALLVTAIAYAVSPLDLIPELAIPFVGVVDDLAVVALALRAFIPLCPRDVVDEHVRLIDEGN